MSDSERVGETLLRHKPSQGLYLRANIGGKIIRRSLTTTTERIAKLRRDKPLLELGEKATASKLRTSWNSWSLQGVGIGGEGGVKRKDVGTDYWSVTGNGGDTKNPQNPRRTDHDGNAQGSLLSPRQNGTESSGQNDSHASADEDKNGQANWC